MQPEIEEQLREAIRGSKRTQKEIEAGTNIPQPHISAFLAGRRHLSLKAASRLAKYFKMRLTKPVDPKAPQGEQ